MTYNLKRKRSSADDPQVIPQLEPLREAILAAANAKKAKNFRILRLDDEGQKFFVTATFWPRGRRTALLSNQHLTALQTIKFNEEKPFRWSFLRKIGLKYGGDIPNEAVFSFFFIPRWGRPSEIQIRCDDWNAALLEMRKK